MADGVSEQRRLLVSIKEAATATGVSVPEMRKRIADGSVPFVRWGRRVLIPWSRLEELVQTMTQQSAPSRKR